MSVFGNGGGVTFSQYFCRTGGGGGGAQGAKGDSHCVMHATRIGSGKASGDTTQFATALVVTCTCLSDRTQHTTQKAHTLPQN